MVSIKRIARKEAGGRGNFFGKKDENRERK